MKFWKNVLSFFLSATLVILGEGLKNFPAPYLCDHGNQTKGDTAIQDLSLLVLEFMLIILSGLIDIFTVLVRIYGGLPVCELKVYHI